MSNADLINQAIVLEHNDHQKALFVGALKKALHGQKEDVKFVACRDMIIDSLESIIQRFPEKMQDQVHMLLADRFLERCAKKAKKKNRSRQKQCTRPN